jgi:hypothetical protein
MIEMRNEASHAAYADESSVRDPEYRSIACVSMRVGDATRINTELQDLLRVGEFKWQDLREGRMRDQALALVDYTLPRLGGTLRVDVLVWSMKDERRRNVIGLADIGDLSRMYYQLVKIVMERKWRDADGWDLYPDEHTEIDWKTMFDVLGRPRRMDLGGGLLEHRDVRALHHLPKFRRLTPSNSKQFPAIQLADLFAGLVAFSWRDRDCYEAWMRENDSQGSLLDTPLPVKRKPIETNRCIVLNHLLMSSRRQRLGVGISNGGLTTMPGSKPLNFWKWTPQSRADRAPVRKKL